MGKENTISGWEQINLFPDMPVKRIPDKNKKRVGEEMIKGEPENNGSKELKISAEEVFKTKLRNEFNARREELMPHITVYLKKYLPDSREYEFGVLRQFLKDERLEKIKRQRREGSSNELGFWLARVRDLTNEVRRPMKRYLKDAKKAEENLTRGLPEDY